MATSALAQHGAAVLELVATFEAGHVADDGDDSLDDGEYVIESLGGKRYSNRSGRIEYLVRWQGYGEEEDTWEEAEGLPADLRDAYDAAVRTSTRPMRSRRAA